MLLLGCADPQVQADIEQIRDSLKEATARIDSVEQRVGSIELNRMLDEMVDDAGKRVVVDPAGDQGFSMIKSKYGPLAFIVNDVSQRADGSEVVLRVGNLTSANINGGKLRIQYGPRRMQNETYSEWESSLNEGTFQFNTTLRSGFWNPVTLTLPGAPPSSLGHIKITIEELPSISLNTR